MLLELLAGTRPTNDDKIVAELITWGLENSADGLPSKGLYDDYDETNWVTFFWDLFCGECFS